LNRFTSIVIYALTLGKLWPAWTT